MIIFAKIFIDIRSESKPSKINNILPGHMFLLKKF